MKKTQVEQQRFEFIFLINNNIICQRYFDIKGYNEDCRNSLELREMLSDIAGINTNQIGSMGTIPGFLKKNTENYLWGYYNPHKEQQTEDILIKNIHEKADNFQFEVRVDGQLLASTTFSGSPFPPKVRYSVNIKELIPEIISDIRYYLTKPSYTTQYGAVSLFRSNKLEKSK